MCESLWYTSDRSATMVFFVIRSRMAWSAASISRSSTMYTPKISTYFHTSESSPLLAKSIAMASAPATATALSARSGARRKYSRIPGFFGTNNGTYVSLVLYRIFLDYMPRSGILCARIHRCRLRSSNSSTHKPPASWRLCILAFHNTEATNQLAYLSNVY